MKRIELLRAAGLGALSVDHGHMFKLDNVAH